MTIRDLTEQFEIQGNVTIKQWDDEKETYATLLETDSAIFNDKVLDMEIKYMYAVDDILMIEV